MKECKHTEFHQIDCLYYKDGDKIMLGFEGCYNGNINHPDPRPAHRIWIEKTHAEKLHKLFRYFDDPECPMCTNNAGWTNGYCSVCGHREEINNDAESVTGEDNGE